VLRVGLHLHGVCVLNLRLCAAKDDTWQAFVVNCEDDHFQRDRQGTYNFAALIGLPRPQQEAPLDALQDLDVDCEALALDFGPGAEAANSDPLPRHGYSLLAARTRQQFPKVRQYMHFSCILAQTPPAAAFIAHREEHGVAELMKGTMVVKQHQPLLLVDGEDGYTCTYLSSEPGGLFSGTDLFVPSAFNLDELCSITAWSEKPRLGFLPRASALPAKTLAAAAGVLANMMDIGAVATDGTEYVVDIHAPGGAATREVLHALESEGLVVCRQGSAEAARTSWQITSLNKLTACQAFVGQPHRVLEHPRGPPADEWSVFELISYLHTHGWEHEVHDGQGQPVHELGGDRVWYTKPGAKTIGRLYLLSLATIQDRPIPHLQPEPFYQAFLAGKEYQPKAPPKKEFTYLPDGADESALAVVRPKRQPRRRCRRMAPEAVVPDDAVDAALALHDDEATESAQQESDGGLD